MIKQILNTFYTRLLTGIFNLVIAILISNYLGAEGKGIQGLIITTISLLVVFTGIVGSGGLTYLLPRFKSNLLLIPSYIWSFLIVLILWMGIHFLSLIPAEYELDVIILSLILSVFNINNSILIAGKKIEKSNVLTIVQILSTMGVITFFAIDKRITVHAYILALYIGYLCSLLMSFIFTSNYYRGINFNENILKYRDAFKQLLKFGGFNQLDILAQFMSFRLAYYLLNYFIDPAQVGIYSNGVSIIESVWLLSRSISFVLHSQIVNLQDTKYITEVTLKFLKLSLLLASIAVLVLIFIPSDLYRFVFGNEFGAIKTVIHVLAPGVLFFSLSFILSSFYSGTGRHHINSVSSFAGLVVIGFASALLIPRYGIVGAGLAASFSYFVTTVIKLWYFRSVSGYHFKKIFIRRDDLIYFRSVLRNIFNSDKC